MPEPGRYVIVCACNDREILARNLGASPLVRSGAARLHLVEGAPSAAQCYNRALAEADCPVVILAHQDVYLPPGWEARLEAALAALDRLDPGWSVAGPIGIDEAGRLAGQVWSSSQGGLIGAPAGRPRPVQSLDELLLLIRRDSGLRFDDSLPGFHMYGTDIVQQARVRGLGAYACDLPLVHNDRFHAGLGADFAAGYRHLRRKWRARLPIRTTVLPVTRSGFELAAWRLRARLSVGRRRGRAADPGADPRLYARRCGWE